VECSAFQAHANPYPVPLPHSRNRACRDPDAGWLPTRGAHLAAEGDKLQTVAGETAWHLEMSRGDWHIRTVTETRLTADRSHFHVAAKLTAWEGEDQVYRQEWTEKIERRLV
jgi:hypothetical protein